MPRPGADLRRRGRRGRRTALMVQAARSRIDDLFGLAVIEGLNRPAPLADRYVALARSVGTRYNVRIPPEYRELYCRGCSSYWTEGRTVRSRLRGRHRVRTCLVCGRIQRTPLGPRPTRGDGPGDPVPQSEGPEPMLAAEPSDPDEEAAELGSEDEE